LRTEGAHQHGSTLRDYLRVVRRRRWIILQAVILVPLAAVLFSVRQESMYQASAEVLQSQQNLAAALTGTTNATPTQQADRVAQTQADLARVPEVASRTIAAVGLKRSPLDLLGHSSVTAKANADLLVFSVTDHSPELAATLAGAYAKQFVAFRQELDTASLQRARAEVRVRVRQLEKAGATRTPLYASLVEKDQQLATIEALQTSNASVVRTADRAVQVQPKPARNGILGLALGLVVGLGLAFLWEALDTRVRSAEEIASKLGLPLLARLPAPPRQLRKDEKLVMLAEPRGVQAEAFRMLRTNLEFVRLGHDVRTIMVTSAVEQEGKSTTVANLAVALARAGQRVALVDLDLRRPFLDHFFDLRYRPGLTQVALGQTNLDEALIPIAITDVAGDRRARTDNGNGDGTERTAPSLATGGLHVLVSGPLPPNAGEFVGSEALAHVLGELRERFDTVLIDAPPLLQVGDPLALSAHVGALFMVTRMSVVRRPMLTEARRLLDTAPSLKLGFVLTGAETEGRLRLRRRVLLRRLPAGEVDPDFSVLVLEPLPRFRAGVRGHLTEESDFEVVEAVDLLGETHVVVWSFAPEPHEVLAAIRAGAHGCLHKEISSFGLVRALRALPLGEAPLSRDLAAAQIEALHGQEAHSQVQARLAVLSAREREVLELVALAARISSIAESLSISEFTVKRHVQNILGKLGVASRTAAGAIYSAALDEERTAVLA
jgi:polysaccharide biosynthesis transport protein